MSSKTTAKNTVAPPSPEERAYLATQQKLAAQQLDILGTQAEFQTDYMAAIAPLLDQQSALMGQELAQQQSPEGQALQQQTREFQANQIQLAQEQLDLTRAEMQRASSPEALAQLQSSEQLLTAQVAAATEQLNLAQSEMQRLQSPEQRALLDATTRNQLGQAGLAGQQIQKYGELLNDPVQAEIMRRSGGLQLAQLNDAANLPKRRGPSAPTTPTANAPTVPTIGLASAPNVPNLPRAQGANPRAGALEGELLQRQRQTLENGYNISPQQQALIDQQYRSALDMGGSDISTYASESMQRLRDELAPSLGLRPTDTPILDRGGLIQREATRQYGQLARSLAGQQAGASLQYPLETARLTDASSQTQQGLGLANRQFVQGAGADAAKFGFGAELAGSEFEHGANLEGAQFGFNAGLSASEFEFGGAMDAAKLKQQAELQKLQFELQAQEADRAYQMQVSQNAATNNANLILGASGLTGQSYGTDLNAQRQTMLGSTTTNPVSGAAGAQQAGTIGLANQSFQTGLAEQAALNRAQLLGTAGNYTELGMTGGIGLANASQPNAQSFARGGTTTTTAQPGFAEIMGGIGGLMQGAGAMGATFSDERVKESIQTHHYDDQGRRWVSFVYKDDPLKFRRLGVIAQEVRETDPDAVIERKDGVLLVDYSKLKVA